MPELPEVEVLRRSLVPHLVGERIVGIDVARLDLREEIDAPGLRSALSGERIREVRRRAKYLLVDVDGRGPGKGSTLVVHLGMSGRLTVVDGDEPRRKHEHVGFRLASGRRLRFVDPRRFGLVMTLPTHDLDDDPHFAHLGQEPLEGGFSGQTLACRAAGRRLPVKNFLMDATVVAGLGNIYACETLFAAGVHPTRSVARIAAKRWTRIATSAREVLERAIAEGGTTLSDYVDGTGERGWFQVSLGVYGREGESCRRCRRTIRRRVQAGRSTFYCPGCQT